MFWLRKTCTPPCIFLWERVTLHLEQEIPNETDTHPFKGWVLTFFHPSLLSKPWLVVPVVKTHNLVVAAAFLLSVVLITYFKIRLPLPQPRVPMALRCELSSACHAGRERGKAFIFCPFLEASSQRPLLPSFLHLLLKLFPESIFKPPLAESWEHPCTVYYLTWARSYPSGVSTQPQKCPAQTYGPSWAQ